MWRKSEKITHTIKIIRYRSWISYHGWLVANIQTRQEAVGERFDTFFAVDTAYDSPSKATDK
ncbi:hypothetical protein DUT91_23960 [Phyllobacterium salinisoli]|uniref:Uncharacterized protein n=1 Tax=Phyllobacterium salinisoli TaxID=1899321 RepID=A0A368JWA9_9HYPH|nr:hypothetical protein DUT91_23960 [Phyllobacterium salinisoli]